MLFGQDSAVVMVIIIYKLMDIILLHFTQYPTESLTLTPKKKKKYGGILKKLGSFRTFFLFHKYLMRAYCVPGTVY